MSKTLNNLSDDNIFNKIIDKQSLEAVIENDPNSAFTMLGDGLIASPNRLDNVYDSDVALIWAFGMVNVDLAIALLNRSDESKQANIISWVLTTFPVDDKIKVLQQANIKSPLATAEVKLWLCKNWQLLDRYLIKKVGQQVTISRDGEGTDVNNLPDNIVSYIHSICHDMLLWTRRVFTADGDIKLIAESLEKISNNSLWDTNIETKSALLELLSDTMHWNDFSSPIISTDCFLEYINT